MNCFFQVQNEGAVNQMNTTEYILLKYQLNQNNPPRFESTENYKIFT